MHKTHEFKAGWVRPEANLDPVTREKNDKMDGGG